MPTIERESWKRLRLDLLETMGLCMDYGIGFWAKALLPVEPKFRFKIWDFVWRYMLRLHVGTFLSKSTQAMILNLLYESDVINRALKDNRLQDSIKHFHVECRARGLNDIIECSDCSVSFGKLILRKVSSSVPCKFMVSLGAPNHKMGHDQWRQSRNLSYNPVRFAWIWKFVGGSGLTQTNVSGHNAKCFGALYQIEVLIFDDYSIPADSPQHSSFKYHLENTEIRHGWSSKIMRFTSSLYFIFFQYRSINSITFSFERRHLSDVRRTESEQSWNSFTEIRGFTYSDLLWNGLELSFHF